MLDNLQKAELKSVDFSKVKLPHSSAPTAGVGCKGAGCAGVCG